MLSNPLLFLVCGITKTWDPESDPNAENPVITDVIGVAGEIMSHGGHLDPKLTRLKTSDKDIEGVDMELHGGIFNDEKQKAVISFICDREWTGNEGYEEDKRRALGRRDDDDDNNGDSDSDGDGDGQKDPSDRYKQDSKSALQFVSYQGEDEGKNRMHVLRLTWKTKYACESLDRGDDGAKTAGWGFFTWFILMYVTCIIHPAFADSPTVSSSELLHTLSLARGSTTTGTALAAGTFFLMATPLETFPIYSKTGHERSLIR